MSADFQELETLLEQVKLLPPEYRVRLMQGILDSLLVPPPIPKAQMGILQFGAYKEYDGPQSTLQDYKMAEWHLAELEWDGE